MQRVSQMLFYRQAQNSIMRLNEGIFKLNEQAASGKRINSPSDDPVGSITAQIANRRILEIEQYDRGVDHANSWLMQAESNMQDMQDQLTRAKELAEQMATGTYSSEQRASVATEIENIISQLIVLANVEVGDSYIFSGTRGNLQAASQNLRADGAAEAHGGNSGSGVLYAKGDYTGNMSRTISLTVDGAYAGGVPAAANPMDVDVSYVDDYGRTITHTVTLTGTGSGAAVYVGDGIQVYAESLAYAADDQFTLNVGRQQGNQEELDVNLSWSNSMRYNYTLDQLYGQEGYLSGEWSNILDMLTDWKEALLNDDFEQDYFKAVGATYNNPSTSAELQVSGDFTDLNGRDLEFNVGGPIQSQSADADLSDYRNFQVDAAYAGGVPSADNPMDLDYEYWNGVAWVPQTATVTGTGYDDAVALAGGVEIYVADASYTAGDGPFQLTPVYPENTEPSAANPMTMTYTYTDDAGVRRYASVTFTGTGAANSQTLDPPGDVTLALKQGSTFDDFDAFTLTLEQYGQGQKKSQEMLPELENSTATLLKYIADAGARLNRLEVRTKLLEDDSLRLYDRLSDVEDAEVTEVITNLETYELMYQAALQATAAITSRTLADYL